MAQRQGCDRSTVRGYDGRALASEADDAQSPESHLTPFVETGSVPQAQPAFCWSFADPEHRPTGWKNLTDAIEVIGMTTHNPSELFQNLFQVLVGRFSHRFHQMVTLAAPQARVLGFETPANPDAPVAIGQQFQLRGLQPDRSLGIEPDHR